MPHNLGFSQVGGFFISSSIMSLFFRLLPTDLQIDILHSWLDANDCGRTLLRALSSLDIACHRLDRPAYRLLVCLIPPFGQCSPQTKEWTKYVANYLQWLDSRKAAVRSLQLVGHMDNMELLNTLHSTAMTLPFVETLCLSGTSLMPSKVLDALLRCCPWLTSLSCHAIRPSEPLAALTAPLTGLQTLTICGAHPESLKTLEMYGPQLRELRMEACPLTDELAALIRETCPALQVLEVMMIVNIEELVSLLEACPYIRHLAFRGLDQAGITQVLAFQQIKRLVIHPHLQCSLDSTVFANMLALRPDMEHLELALCKYSQDGGQLGLGWAGQLDATVLTAIFSNCPVVSNLTIAGKFLEGDLANVIAQRCGNGSLTSLNLMSATAHTQLGIVLQTCGPFLKHFSISGIFQPQHLCAIAEYCTQLESLYLLPFNRSLVTDGHFIAIIAACPHIKELKLSNLLGVTRAGLEAIIEHRLHLRKITMVCSFTVADMEWFCQEVRDHDLLPVPVMRIKVLNQVSRRCS